MHVGVQSMPLTLQQTATDPYLHQRLLDNYRKSPVGSLFLSPGSWCTRFSCALQESISQSYVNSGCSIVGLMVTSSKRTYAIVTPRAPVTVADHCWPVPPQEALKHSSVPSLCSPWVFVHTKFVWALWASLAGMELILSINSPPYCLARASPLPLDVGYLHTAGPAKCSHCSWPQISNIC